MILGIYYLSQPPYQEKRIEGYFVNTSEIEHALETGQIKVHSRIVSRFTTVDENEITFDTNTLSFDRKYTFTVSVGDNYQTVSTSKEFNLTVSLPYGVEYGNMTAEGLPLPAHALVDGNLVPPKMPLPTTAIIKGDERSLSIAAASIVAKTTRDQVMCKLAEAYPGYGWSSNMGYGTKSHQIGIEKLGITPQHRKSFKPIRNY